MALHIAESETPLPPKVARVAERVRTRHNVVIRSANLKQMAREMALVKRIYNDSWTRNWGFMAFTDAEIDYAAADLKMVLDPDLGACLSPTAGRICHPGSRPYDYRPQPDGGELDRVQGILSKVLLHQSFED